MDHWNGIQQHVATKPDIKSCSTFDGNLAKRKLFKDRILAVASIQQMITLIKPHYKLPRHPDAFERNRNSNVFLFSALLFETAGGQLPLWSRNPNTLKMEGWLG